MAYEKRVCVLRQVKRGFTADGSALSGAVYCERLGKELTVTVRLAGLAPIREGRYVLVLGVGGKTYCFDLDGGDVLKINDAPPLGDGFNVLLCYLRQEASPVAFGNCGLASSDFLPLLNALCKRDEKKKKQAPMPVPPVELPPTGPNVPQAPFIPDPAVPEEEPPAERACFRERANAYDDEAIADADYFLSQDDRNASAASKNQDEKREESGGDDSDEDDETLHPFARTKGSLTYYKEIRKDLENAFRTRPGDTRLLSVFPQSEWVKANGALLGIIYENGTPRYLCVATEKDGDPPKEIKDRCTFVPSSPFSDELGFYIVFQDADTGEYVTVNNA